MFSVGRDYFFTSLVIFDFISKKWVLSILDAVISDRISSDKPEPVTSKIALQPSEYDESRKAFHFSISV